jgi:alpha-L-rhamnosidase
MMTRLPPPAVFWSGQAIDPAGPFKAMRGIRRTDGVNRWFLFRRSVVAPASGGRCALRIAVDGRYRLIVNGQDCGGGPARHGWRTPVFLEHDVSHALQPGENVIALVLHTLGVDAAWYEAPQGWARASFGDGAVWVDGAIDGPAWSVDCSTRSGWRAILSDAWRSDTPRSNDALDFIESLDLRRLEAGWDRPGFNDSHWPETRALRIGGGPPDAPFGGMRHERFPILRAAGVAPLREWREQARRLIRACARHPQPDLPIEARLYREADIATHALWRGPEGLVSGEAVHVRTDHRDAALLLDFGVIRSARPFVDVTACGGETLEIAVAEGLPGEWGAGEPGARITPAPLLGLDAHLWRLVLKPGRQTVSRFAWAGARYLELVVRDAPRGLTIHEAGLIAQRFPAEVRGRFTCSDQVLTRIWDAGVNTLAACMQDGWIDCPSREQRQWLGDVLVEYPAARMAFDPSVDRLNAKHLRDAAQSQRTDGLTQMFAPGDHATDAIVIPDWTLAWVLTAHEHWRLSAERDVLEEVFPAIVRALGWFEARLDAGGGLIADCPYWLFMDWSAFGRTGWSAALNAMAAGAFSAAADIATAVEAPLFARRFAARAAAIAAALQSHWDEARGVFVDVVEPESGRLEPRVSQHANAGAVLWGIARPDQARRIVAALSDQTRLKTTAAPPVAPTGEVFDPAHDIVRANTFFSHFVHEALAKAGRVDLALADIRSAFAGMIAAGATTLWENLSPTASLCHGFSAGPLTTLVRHVLGLSPAAPGFARLRFAPDLADLDWAEGALATRLGDVEVSLRRIGQEVDATLIAPAGLQIEITPPPGMRLVGDPASRAAGAQAAPNAVRSDHERPPTGGGAHALPPQNAGATATGRCVVSVRFAPAGGAVKPAGPGS